MSDRDLFLILADASTFYAGVLSVSPPEGISADLFDISASDWSDDVEDYPLEYAFKALSYDQNSTAEILLNPLALSESLVRQISLPLGFSDLTTIRVAVVREAFLSS